MAEEFKDEHLAMAEEQDREVVTDQAENLYRSVRGYVVEAQKQVYSAVNSAMVTAYWNIGKTIYEACGENDRAAYGKRILDDISKRLAAEFGKGCILSIEIPQNRKKNSLFSEREFLIFGRQHIQA